MNAAQQALSDGPMREMTAEEIVADLGLDEEGHRRALMAVERAKKAALRTPNFTRLILASEDLLPFWGTRDDRGYRITVEWGEPRPEGWYEPVFTVHNDEPLPALTDALAQLSASLDTACGYCGSVNGLTPVGHLDPEPLTGSTVRSAIEGSTDLINPRLSELDWDRVAAVLSTLERPASLDTAWQEAVEALPEGWELVQVMKNPPGGWAAFAEPRLVGGTEEEGDGDTPQEALHALALALRAGATS